MVDILVAKQKEKTIGNRKEFFKLKVNVFKNKNNGQLSITLPKKRLNDVPNKINIRLPKFLFKPKMEK